MFTREQRASLRPVLIAFLVSIIGLQSVAKADALEAARFAVTHDGETHYTGLLRGPADQLKTFAAPHVRADLPDNYDSFDHDLMTRIKDQGSCGSCWDFSMTRVFETALIKAGVATAVELDLSEQDFLVNGKKFGHYGCSGGFMNARFLVEQGEALEAACPYKARDTVACSAAKFAKAASWKMLGTSSRAPTVDELRTAIYENGAVSVTVAAGGSAFKVNSAGEITTCGNRGLDHMVVLSGWVKKANGKFGFLMDNSWSEDWGGGTGVRDGRAIIEQGCNQIASVAGDAALIITVDPVDPPPPPPPPPPPAMRIKNLPLEYTIWKGDSVQIGVAPPYPAGVRYRWNTGKTGGRTTVDPQANTTYQVTATEPSGQKVVGTVQVKVQTP